MARRRGFFAEIQHQAAVAQREQQKAKQAAVRAAEKQRREAEHAYLAAKRAELKAQRAEERELIAAEKEAKRLQVQARIAEVEALNAELALTLEEVDNVLHATLDVDDHVDLNELRTVVEHPPFASPNEKPTPQPAPIVAPPEPQFTEPPAPKGLSALFGKSKYAAALLEAQQEHERRLENWQAEVASVARRQLVQMKSYQEEEEKRVAGLARDRETYDAECKERQAKADAENIQLDLLIARHQAGDKEAVEEYFGIVFGNSVYPECVELDIDYSYTPVEKELTLNLDLPAPEAIPSVRTYRYVKAKDEIAETAQSQKEQRERYNDLVNNLVLRTLHEVWESDRLGHVQTISLTASVAHIDPATGRPTQTPVVAVAAYRPVFEEIDLAHVTPSETLKHLNAVVSKNPHGKVAIPDAGGVRG